MRKDTWRPALVGFVSIIIYSITALLLLGRLGLLSLMVADAVKHVVHTIIMLWILRRQLGNLAGNPVLFSAIKSLAAALLTGLAAYGAAWLVAGQLDASPLVMRLSPVIAGGIVGVLAYTAAVLRLILRETRLAAPALAAALDSGHRRRP